ncbi:non-specific serine,threonine protein kinase, partial [Sarracenia purpurea var. burkii]
GRLKDGTLVAIKVLSAESRQGLKEFLTEIIVISDVHHENLVKLDGCCVEGSHRILVWEQYDRRELPMLVDVSLERDVDVDEACKYLKIGLLCTQGMPKLRPSMSKVVELLSGEMNVEEEKITKPGLISELVGLKSQKDSSYPLSADSRKTDDSSSGITTATYATMTFTSIEDRSV